MTLPSDPFAPNGRDAVAGLLESLRRLVPTPTGLDRPEKAVAPPSAVDAIAPSLDALAPALELVRLAREAIGEKRGGDAAAARAAGAAGPRDLGRLIAAALRGADPLRSGPDGRWDAPPADADADYDEPHEAPTPRELLQERERRLKRDRVLTARILDQMERGAAVASLPRRSPLQQELRILCPAGGSSGGRFLLRNELGRAARIRFRALPLHAVAGSAAARAQVAVEPAEVELDGGEERLVRVRVDLTDAPPGVPEIEVVVDAIAGDDVVQKVWTTIVVTGGGSAP